MKTQRTLEIKRSSERQIAQVCLQLAGGGYNARQTAAAIEYQRTLFEAGELVVGHIKIVLIL